ncbi:hypothetical protein KH5_17460 [Urechidicola sp. KH5]
MLKKITLIILFFVSVAAFAQDQPTDSTAIDQDKPVSLKGTIIDGASKNPLGGAHVFNMNSVRGTITLNDGTFTLPTKVNDTIFISYLGFQSVKIRISNDLLKGNELEITMYQKDETLTEVNVKSTTLVGVLEIDAKNIPKDKFTRIHIDGLPQTYEVGAPRRNTYSSAVDAVFHPVDFIYNKFGKNPKQLRKLKQIKEQDEVRAVLDEKIDRELMLQYLELTREELDELLDDCNYSDYFIQTASDIQVLEAVLECYENYRAVKTGSTKKKD